VADKKPEPTQKTQPRGVDPKTGKPYKAVQIPVPKRKDFDKLLQRATRADPEKIEPKLKKGSNKK
jgi:hypothetical protein